MKMYNKIVVYITDENKAKIKAKAEKLGISVSKMMVRGAMLYSINETLDLSEVSGGNKHD